MANNRLQQLKALLQESPHDSFLLFAIAKEFEKMGDPEEALHHYLNLVEKEPDYIGTYYHLGKLYERMEETGLAWKIYTKGIARARRAGEQHALGELIGARMALGDEEDFE